MPTASGERTAADAAVAANANDAAAVSSDTPNVETEAYKRMKARSKKCRDLMEGVEAIRRGGTEYLPTYPGEGTTRYDARRTIAALFNGYKATVRASVGLLLQSPPVLGKDMPAALVTLWENVDAIGTHGDVFAKHLATAGTVDGLAGILTEYPRVTLTNVDFSKASLAAREAVAKGETLDAADEEALGLRPYFILVKSDNVVLPLYQSVNGRKTLVMLVIRETATERVGRFGFASVTRYRVYTLNASKVTYELWTETNGSVAITEGPTVMRNLTAIPWSPMAVGEEIKPGEFVPPLMDLAELNLTHHRIQTGVLSLEERAFIPTLVRIGAQPDQNGVYPQITLGPGDTIEAPAMPGVAEPIYWTSPPVDVLEPGMKSLETCKAEMGAMGMNFLAPDPRAAETATANRADNTAQRASIITVGRALKDCLESAFGFAGQYIKQTAGTVTINNEFEKLTLDAQTMSAYAALSAEGFPKIHIVKALQAGGRVDPDVDPQQIVDEWEDRLAEIELKKRVDARVEADRLAAEGRAVGQAAAQQGGTA